MIIIILIIIIIIIFLTLYFEQRCNFIQLFLLVIYCYDLTRLPEKCKMKSNESSISNPKLNCYLLTFPCSYPWQLQLQLQFFVYSEFYLI